MKKIKLLIMFLIAFVVCLSSCSGNGLGEVGDQLGDIKDQIGDQLGDNEALKETLITSVDEVLTKEGFKKCYSNLKDYDFSKVTNWNAEIASVVDLFDLLHQVRNKEINIDDFIAHYETIRNTIFVNDVLVKCSSEIIPLLPIISEYYDETVVINDWGKELDACVYSLEALYKNDIRSLNDIISEDSKLNGSMMIIFMDSELIKAVLVKEINKKLSETDLITLEIKKADLEQIHTASEWDLELDALFDLLDIANHASTLEYSEIVAIYAEVKLTILCKQILVDAAPDFAEKLPVVSNYYDESLAIEDWESELDAIIASVDALDKANITDLNDLLNEDSTLDGEMMLTFAQSIILKSALVEELNKALEQANLEPNLITIEDIDALNSSELWDKELSAMRNLISLKDNSSTLEFSEIVEIYNEVRVTSLCNKVLIASAPVMAETLPVVSDYYDESVVIEDWSVELDAIIASVEALDQADLNNFADLLSEDSPLDGAMMLTFCGSTILKNAVVDEINKALESTGLESNLITITDIEDLTEDAWNAELSAMRNLISLKDNSSTLEFSEIVEIYEEVRLTTLCNKVLMASAPVMAETLPVVSDYYDESVVIEDWSVELDAIIATIDALSDANATAITNPLAEGSPLNGKVLYSATRSTILTKAIVDEMNNAIKASGLAENIITIENVQAVDSVDAWNAELDCMRRLVAIDFADTNMNTVIDIYDDIKENTILCDSILVSSAAIIIPDLPIICNYYDESLGITDWGEELDAIVNAYKLLVNKGLANINNPIQTLDGQIIIACLESKILKAAFIQEFNNNLTVLGLGAYYTMDEDNLAELDTAEKWDNELAAIQAVSDLVNNFSFTKVPTVKAQVESTIIAKAILASFLSSMGIIL